MQYEVVGKQDGCGNHAKGDGQTIGPFHVSRVLEIKNNAATSYKKQKIDGRNEQLTSLFCRIYNFKLGP